MPGQERHTGSRIVAGVTARPRPLRLRWAVSQSELTGAAVDAVIAWHYPIPTGGYGWAPTGMATSFNFKENAEKVLAEAISTACGPGGSVPVRARVVEGNPAQVLLDASDGADLWSWAAAGTAGSSRRCSARSASTACTARAAPWS